MNTSLSPLQQTSPRPLGWKTIVASVFIVFAVLRALLAAYSLVSPSPDMPQLKAIYHLVGGVVTAVVLALYVRRSRRLG